MKIKHIALGCALAAAAIGAQAASAINGRTVIFFSGASAPDKFMADISTSILTGAVQYRGVNADNSINGNYNAFVGEANNIPGVANGTKLAIIKRSEGGSERGVGPVGQQLNIRTMDLNDCDLTARTCKLMGDDQAGVGGLVPDMGVSDVEPAMFVGLGVNVPSDGAETPANLFAEVQPVNQLMFGIVATNSIPAGTHLSRVGYGNLLSGKYETWSQFSAALNDGAAEDNVVVCRRVPGSGTQASYNMYFNNFPCGAAANASTTIAGIGDTDFNAFNGNGDGSEASPFEIDPSLATGKIVIENSGSGDVRNCLKAANNRTEHKTKGADGFWYTVKFQNGTKPYRAIGVLSTDSYGKESGWAFRMLDGAGTYNLATDTASAGATGVAPSKANLVSGAYDFVLELSMQHAGLTGVKKAVFDEMVRRAGSTTYTGDTTGTFTTVPNAFATLPQIGDAVAQPTLVARHTRFANSCAPLQKF